MKLKGIENDPKENCHTGQIARNIIHRIKQKLIKRYNVLGDQEEKLLDEKEKFGRMR